MSKIETVKQMLATNKSQIPYAIFRNLSHKGLINWLPDKLYIQIAYRLCTGKKLNLKNPRSFNEKLQWLKLYDRKPEYTMMVDKYKVREYIAKTIGSEYLIPLLGVWESVEDIDFESLPNQFVLKCNHDSGSVVICKDKSKLNVEDVKKKLNKSLHTNGYWFGREWPYKDVKPCITAEKYMVDDSGTELCDFKFMCFNGKFKCAFTCTERFTKTGVKVTFFNTLWERMPFERYYPSSKLEVKKPLNYDQMVEFAEKLSENIPFARIDFYEVQGHMYFGEITLFPENGLEEFNPEQWDYKLGSWIKLPGGGLIIYENIEVYIPIREKGAREIVDYKFYCFDGEPVYCQVIKDRNTNETIDFYDMDWNWMNFTRIHQGNQRYPHSAKKQSAPATFPEMKEFSKKLANGLPFARVDYYCINGKTYFGEITLYPAAGFGEFSPESANFEMGEKISLPENGGGILK